ncbi:molybdopterin-dependent oxidoreductase [Massilia sp. RP-1-19]|uniref:Molybdopterin-dependent oxidoreductase n=1 Tax=Massilia polaris TaxID=2728846 RepID=A0A848HFT9_9BURK|nr:nitrate reductase [Massilia polaris]NML59937.1 molybdopterin-dependent oxidoreductase [Massilia polaris]
MKISPIPLAVRTTCAYCGVGCGVQATPQADGSIGVKGDPAHPANNGKLCVKGSALGETLGLEGRLLHPQVREDGAMRRASWDEALERVARGFSDIIAEHGPGSVALYVSGQLLTEDYYVANKLMKGYIGTANIDTNSRLCMSSSVAGHKRAFGADIVPGCYEDFDLADMVVLTGSNAAWCHPVLFQRIARLKERRPEVMVVVIDPRRTATCELADLHLPVKPGTDVWLFNGLLSFLAREGAMDAPYIDGRTTGLAEALAVANADCADPMEVVRICRVEPAKLLAFYRAFAATAKVVTAYSQGVNQSSAGTDKVNSIINCHLATGRIGRPGMGPFSLTGQPNAMGGREVGGMANMLAAHMDLDKPEHRDLVQGFWNSPRIADKPGLKAVDLFHAIEAGKVKAVWIIGTNPMVSLPDANQVQRALEKCELVVASEIMASTDTTAFADVLLPALGWGEKDGTVTNSERCISRQRAFLPAPGEARADWKILCQVAQRMGFDGFEFGAPHEIFDEHARLSSWRNGADEGGVKRAFKLEGLAGLGAHDYDTLDPVQWPVLRGPGGAAVGTARIDCGGKFVATAPRGPVHAASAEYPLALNTGRVRDQWHTMTRTGKAPRLAGHVPESFVDLHPHDALLYGVREGELARVSSAWGSMVARVQLGGGITRGSVFVPIHWNGQTASDARVGALVSPAVDPVSGEPEFKHTPVMVEHFGVSWHGFLLTRRELALDGVAHWTRIQGSGFARYELAGRTTIAARGAWARSLLGVGEGEDWLEYEDRADGVYRAVHLVDDRIEQCVFVSARPDLPSRAWLAGLFDLETIGREERAGLLAGRSLGKTVDAGPTVCACFGVGRNTLYETIRFRKLTEVSEVTACLKAGGNCGSCVPEIKSLLVEARMAEDMLEE